MPKKFNNTQTDTIAFRITPYIREGLEDYAKSNGFLSISDAARDIIRREIVKICSSETPTDP